MTDARTGNLPLSLECELYRAGFVQIADGVWCKRSLGDDDVAQAVSEAYEEIRREFSVLCPSAAA